MADQSDFNKPDQNSNYSNEVLETLQANIKAALAMFPGSRANPGTGAVRRTSPSAGEIVLEASDNDAGSSWTTTFDSRTKVKKAGDTMTGALTINAPANTRIEIQNSGDSNRGGYLSDTGSAFRVASQSGVRPIEIAPDSTVSTTFAVGGNVGIKETPSANFYLAVANGGSSGIRAGLISIGASGAGYPAVGYNVRYTGSNDTYQYHVSDKAAFMTYESGDLNFYTAPTGTAGAAMTPVLAAKIQNNTGNYRFMGAAPKVEHETGGQVVSEIQFGVGARGTIKLRTMTAAGASPVDVFDHGGTSTIIRSSDGNGSVNSSSSQITFTADGVSSIAVIGTSGIAPLSDNTYLCGANGFRWSSVWAANGTIQTSDLTDKADVTQISPDLSTQFIKGLKPIMFRWIEGGKKVERVADGFDEQEIEVQEKYTEEIEEPVFQDVEVDADEQHVSIENGQAVVRQVKVKRTESQPVGQWFDCADENGTPIMRHVGYTKRVVGRGKNKKEVQEPVFERARHFMQETKKVQVERTRTVKKMVQVPRKKTVVTSVPGKRLHAGFGAQDIKALMDELGFDCGLWVLDENGKQHMRPDQMIPFLASALAGALTRIDALEKQLGA